MPHIYIVTRTIVPPLLRILCGLAVITVSLTAQEYLDTAGRWKTLNDLPLSGFQTDFEETDERAVTPLFFSDRLHGVLGTRRGIVYLTSDGGGSWLATRSFTPIPHQRFLDGSGISPNGYFRAAGNDTLWQRLAVDTNQATAAASHDGVSIVSLYQQESISRLAISTDRGVTWRRLDTTTGAAEALRLSPSTRFGPLPFPVGRTIVDRSWREIYGMWDGRTIRVRAAATYDSSNLWHDRHYIGRLDPVTMTAQWSELPSRLGTVRFISSTEAYAFTANPEPPPSARIRIGLWWSIDGGVRWDSVAELPAWVHFAELLSLRFFNRGHGVTENGVTHDGGRTWQRWSHPFAGNSFYKPRLATPDSTRYYIFSPYSHFATSTDAGRTWSRTLGGSIPHAIAASRGRVVVGRDFQTLLFSPDSGESWEDLQPLGRTPAELRTVWSLAWADSIREPQRVIGVASFMTYDARPRVSFIESVDGGRSWREGARIPQFDSAIALAETTKEFGSEEITGYYYAGQAPVVLRFVQKRDGRGTMGLAASLNGLLRSDDAGRTWRLLCDSIRFGNVVMADELHGIGYGLPSHAKPAALYRTTDGGISWKWTKTLSSPYHYAVGFQAFDTNNYRLLTPDMNSKSLEWNIVWTEDGGRTWLDREYTGERANWTMDSYWLDSTDLHIIDAFGDVRHSTNAGNTWHLLHPIISSFARNRERAVISEANQTGSDGSYFYFASKGNLLGRWRIARRSPLPSGTRGETGGAAGAGSAIEIFPNPSNGSSVSLGFRLPRGSTVSVTVADLLGRQRRTLPERMLDAGSQRIDLDLESLEPGSYIVQLVRDGIVTCVRLTIIR